MEMPVHDVSNHNEELQNRNNHLDSFKSMGSNKRKSEKLRGTYHTPMMGLGGAGSIATDSVISERNDLAQSGILSEHIDNDANENQDKNFNIDVTKDFGCKDLLVSSTSLTHLD